MNRRLTALTLVAALGLFACPKPVITPPTPTEPPPPPPVRVPQGCLDNLAGSYRHAQNPSFQYQAFDDGGTLQLFVQRPTLDGGFSSEDGGAVITLTRSPNGFTGATEAQVFTPRGAKCRVGFPTDVTSCFDGGIGLRAAVSASVDETCQTPKKVAPAPKLDHLLLKIAVAPSEEDAGSQTTETPVDANHSPTEDGGVGSSRANRPPTADAGNPLSVSFAADAGSSDGGL
ncbi:MAG: hypothetical protein ACJ790_06500 [Myxococcaceae bacterium]